MSTLFVRRIMDELGVSSCGTFLHNGLEKRGDVQLFITDADVCSLVGMVQYGSIVKQYSEVKQPR